MKCHANKVLRSARFPMMNKGKDPMNATHLCRWVNDVLVVRAPGAMVQHRSNWPIRKITIPKWKMANEHEARDYASPLSCEVVHQIFEGIQYKYRHKCL